MDDAPERPTATLYERYRDLLRRGHLAALGGDPPEALAAYREAAALITSRAAPLLGVGRMELALGRPQVAIEAFEAALVVEPGHADATAELTAVRTRLAAAEAAPMAPARSPRSDDDPVIRSLADRWAVAEADGDAEGLLDVAVGFARADRPAAATTVLRDALALAPAEPQAFRVAAWLAQRAGRSAEASETRTRLRRLLAVLDDGDELERRRGAALDSGDVALLLELAEGHRRQDRPRVALDVAMDALAFAPAQPEVHLAIARARLDLGLRRRALSGLEYLARSIDLNGDVAGRVALARFVDRELLADAPGPEGI